MTTRTKLSSFFLATVAVAGAQALTASDASADSVAVHFGAEAGVHVDIGAGVASVLGALAHVEVGVGVGVHFSQPPPPPVPAYYVEPVVYVAPAPIYVPQPVYVAPQPYVAATAPAPQRFDRWGLGIFAGSVHVDDQEVGSDLGLLGRYRVSRAFSVEAEVAKSETLDGDRADRRLGGAVIWNLPIGRRLTPSLLAGAGYGQSKAGEGEFHARQGYGEIGAGLRYRLSPSVHLLADVRAGTRSMSAEMDTLAKGASNPKEDENYTRARIGGMFFF